VTQRSRQKHDAAQKDFAADLERNARDIIAAKAVVDEENKAAAVKKKNYQMM
jgi:hypothetical protein